MTPLSLWGWEGTLLAVSSFLFFTFLMHILNKTHQPIKWKTHFNISTSDNRVCYFWYNVSLHDVHSHLMCILTWRVSLSVQQITEYVIFGKMWCVFLKQPFVIIAEYGNILYVLFSLSRSLAFITLLLPNTYTYFWAQYLSFSLIPYTNIAYTSCQILCWPLVCHF